MIFSDQKHFKKINIVIFFDFNLTSITFILFYKTK